MGGVDVAAVDVVVVGTGSGSVGGWCDLEDVVSSADSSVSSLRSVLCRSFTTGLLAMALPHKIILSAARILLSLRAFILSCDRLRMLYRLRSNGVSSPGVRTSVHERTSALTRYGSP